MQMRFKLWLEGQITRDVARSIVIDAVGGSELNDDQQQELLGSQLSEQPRLSSTLKKYAVLQPYLDDVLSFVASNQNANLISLINYIQQLDH